MRKLLIIPIILIGFLFIPLSSKGADFTTGLVGRWTLDARDVNWGTNIVLDRSWQGRYGTTTNMTASAVSMGKIGQSLYFNGNTTAGLHSYVTLINPGTVLNGGYLTVSAWIKPTAFPNSYPRIVDRIYNGQFALYLVGASRELSYAIATAGGNVDRAANSTCTGMASSTWHHVALTWDGTTVNAYDNGVVCDSLTGGISGGLDSSAASIRIGQRVEIASGNRGFGGYIDDVRIYNRAFTQQEVKDLYRHGLRSRKY